MSKKVPDYEIDDSGELTGKSKKDGWSDTWWCDNCCEEKTAHEGNAYCDECGEPLG